MANIITTASSSTDKNQSAGFINLSGGISIPFKSKAFLERFETLSADEQKTILLSLIDKSTVQNVWIRSRDADKPSTQEDFLMSLLPAA